MLQDFAWRCLRVLALGLVEVVGSSVVGYGFGGVIGCNGVAGFRF